MPTNDDSTGRAGESGSIGRIFNVAKGIGSERGMKVKGASDLSGSAKGNHIEVCR